jgi:hypothetical protein
MVNSKTEILMGKGIVAPHSEFETLYLGIAFDYFALLHYYCRLSRQKRSIWMQCEV